MLPFSDIDFFLFAMLYVVIISVFKGFKNGAFYKEATFVLTIIYLVFFYKYSLEILAFGVLSFIYISFLAKSINHKLISSIILAIPMILVKVHFNPSLFYFAGLSFVVFRSIQVCIDHTYEKPLNILEYFNFLFFIPSLYIGPLDRYKRFTDNCNNISKVNTSDIFLKGLQELIKGILYKFIIAEFIRRYWLNDDTTNATFLSTTSDIYAYTLFLFFDFAGYSSMAVGMANMVGINLPYNFKAPFTALNPPDFWQRWHASLTSWLSDYFFKPLYKYLNQFKKLKTYPVSKQNIAIFLTLFTMGIWNGFESNFIWSGIVYGVYSVVHNTYSIECRKRDKDVLFGKLNPSVIKYVSIFLMFNFACIALYVFSGRYK